VCPGGNANPSTASENRTTTLSAVISADFTFTSALMIADATSFRTSGVRHALGNLCADNDDDELHGCQYATTTTTRTRTKRTNANYIACSHDARRSHRARAHAPRDVNERHVCARRKLTPKRRLTALTASRVTIRASATERAFACAHRDTRAFDRDAARANEKRGDGRTGHGRTPRLEWRRRRDWSR
jgi:hypothetical protein